MEPMQSDRDFEKLVAASVCAGQTKAEIIVNLVNAGANQVQVEELVDEMVQLRTTPRSGVAIGLIVIGLVATLPGLVVTFASDGEWIWYGPVVFGLGLIGTGMARLIKGAPLSGSEELLKRWKRQESSRLSHDVSATVHLVRFACPNCGKMLKAQPVLKGKKVRCPSRSCGQTFQVPTPVVVALNSNQKWNVSWIVAGAVGIILTGMLSIWFFGREGDSWDTPTPQDESIALTPKVSTTSTSPNLAEAAENETPPLTLPDPKSIQTPEPSIPVQEKILTLTDLVGTWDGDDFTLIIEANGKGRAGVCVPDGNRVQVLFGYFNVDTSQGAPRIAFTLTAAKNQDTFEFLAIDKPTPDSIEIRENKNRITPNPVTLKRRKV